MYPRSGFLCRRSFFVPPFRFWGPGTLVFAPSFQFWWRFRNIRQNHPFDLSFPRPDGNQTWIFFPILSAIRTASCAFFLYAMGFFQCEMCSFWAIVDAQRLSDRNQNSLQNKVQFVEAQSKLYTVNIHLNRTSLIFTVGPITRTPLPSFDLSAIGLGLLGG